MEFSDPNLKIHAKDAGIPNNRMISNVAMCGAVSMEAQHGVLWLVTGGSTVGQVTGEVQLLLSTFKSPSCLLSLRKGQTQDALDQ